MSAVRKIKDVHFYSSVQFLLKRTQELLLLPVPYALVAVG